MGHQRKLGSYGKNRIFWPKTEILGPKKGSHFLGLAMFWPRPEKVVQEKSCLFSNQYQSLEKFLVMFWANTHFWPKKHFSAERKNGLFSVSPARTGSVVILGHFLMGQILAFFAHFVPCPTKQQCEQGA